MADAKTAGMLSGMSPLAVITGNELLEVSSRQQDGSWKTYSILINKIRTNQGMSAYEVAVKGGYSGTEEQWLKTLEGESAYNLAVDNGFVGTEVQWLNSLVGASAYQSAINHGYVGSETQWLASLHGQSAYALAVQLGFRGTEQEWLNTLIGPSPYDIAVDEGYTGTKSQWLETLKGKSIYQLAVDNGYSGTEQEWLAEANTHALNAQQSAFKAEQYATQTMGDASSAEQSAIDAQNSAIASEAAKASAEELRPLIETMTETADKALEDTNSALTETREARDAVVGAENELALMKVLLAAIPADPANAVSSWEIGAKDFNVVQGASTFKPVASRVAGWSLADGVATYLSTIVSLPSHWKTMDVYLKWVNEVANTGNCVIGGEIHKWKVGETINATPAGGSGIMVANPSPFIVIESKIAADLPVDATRMTTIRVARQGASANDTLENAMTILSVRLVKKT